MLIGKKRRENNLGFVPQSDFILAVVPQSENNLGIHPQNGLGINPQTGSGINPHVNLAVIPVPQCKINVLLYVYLPLSNLCSGISMQY